MRSNTDVGVIGRGLFKEHLFGAVTYNDFKHNTAGQTGDDLISLGAESENGYPGFELQASSG